MASGAGVVARGVGCFGGGVGVSGLVAAWGLREGFGLEVISAAGLDASSSSKSAAAFNVRRLFLGFDGEEVGAAISSIISFLLLECASMTEALCDLHNDSTAA